MKYFPKFNKNMIAFERNEGNGNYLIKLAELPELGDMVINHISYKILHLCDGLNDVEKIINTLATEYPNTKRDVIANDVATICSRFLKLGIISWLDNNDPFIIANKKLLDNGYSVKFANEGDFHKLLIHLNNIKREKIFYFADCFEDEYKDITLCSKLFFRIEDFYLLLDNNDNIITAIGVLNRGHKQETKVARLSIITNFDDIESCDFLFSFLCNTYKDNAINETNIIRGCVKVSEETEKIRNILKLKNFECSATLKDELGKGCDIEYFDKKLDNDMEETLWR